MLGTSHRIQSTEGAERNRIAAALIELLSEGEYDAISVASIAERAGLGVEAFHRHFASKQDCLDQVWAETTGELVGRVMKAYAMGQSWRAALRAGGYEAVRFLREDAARARFVAIDCLSAGEIAPSRRDRMMQAVVYLVDGGRQELENPEEVPRERAEAVGATIYDMFSNELTTNGVERLADLVPPLMYLAVLPYLGAEAAEEELYLKPQATEAPPATTAAAA